MTTTLTTNDLADALEAARASGNAVVVNLSWSPATGQWKAVSHWGAMQHAIVAGQTARGVIGAAAVQLRGGGA